MKNDDTISIWKAFLVILSYGLAVVLGVWMGYAAGYVEGKNEVRLKMHEPPKPFGDVILRPTNQQ